MNTLPQKNTSVLAMLLAACVVVGHTAPAFGTFNSYWTTNGYALPFQLFVPAGTEPGHSYPLVVVLHGEEQRGNDNVQPLLTPSVKIWSIAVTNQAVDPLFVLVPQCPAEASWFDLPVLLDLTNVIGRVMAEHPIDPEEVHLDGYSIGARGALRLIDAFPDWWDAAIVTAGALGPHELSDYSGLATVPIWFFAAEDDPLVPLEAAYATFRRTWLAKGHSGNPDPAGDTSDPDLKYTVFPAAMNLGHELAEFAAAKHGYADFFVPVFPTQVNPRLRLAPPAGSGSPPAVEVSGKIGERYVVEASTDLLNWRPVATNALPGTRSWAFTPPVNGVEPSHFFRVHHVHPCYANSAVGQEWAISLLTNHAARLVFETCYAAACRQVIVRLPPDYDPEETYSLILCLHPGNGNARGMEVDRADMLSYIAQEKYRVIVAFPEGILSYDCAGRMWNAWDDSTSVDDVDYLSRLIGWLTSNLKADSERVFICGFSDGAAMTQRFAAARPDLIAAAAAFGHSSGYEYGIPGRTGTHFALPPPVQPGVPMLIFRGGLDARIPPRDTVMSEKGKLVDTPREQLNYWLAANQCDASQFTTHWMKPPAFDLEGDVHIENYAECGSDNVVWFLFDPNLGHRWPRKIRDQCDGDRLVLDFFLTLFQ